MVRKLGYAAGSLLTVARPDGGGRCGDTGGDGPD